MPETPYPTSLWRLFLLLVVVVMAMLASRGSASSCQYCSGLVCCSESNYGPGPLNLTSPDPGYDHMRVGSMAYVYQCGVRRFTSFLWYLEDSNGTAPPRLVEGETGRVCLLRRNQTIRLLKTTEDDVGNYTFVASNGTHNVSGRFQLVLSCQPNRDSLAIAPGGEELHFAVGSEARLRCALVTGLCPWSDGMRSLLWMWQNYTSGTVAPLTNGSLQDVDVICETGTYYGVNCSLVITSVRPVHYSGQFVCQVPGQFPLNRTVRLLPPESVVSWWSPYVQGGVVGVLLTAVTSLVVAVVWRRYGHRLAFVCRPLPSRGHFEHDAVIVHGEDHELFARHKLQPRLQQLGYDVMEEAARLGRPETLEKANAVLTSYCVILTFSDDELSSCSARFITTVATLKSRRAVLLVRCQPQTTDRPALDRAVSRESGDRAVSRKSGDRAVSWSRRDGEQKQRSRTQSTSGYAGPEVTSVDLDLRSNGGGNVESETTSVDTGLRSTDGENVGSETTLSDVTLRSASGHTEAETTSVDDLATDSAEGVSDAALWASPCREGEENSFTKVGRDVWGSEAVKSVKVLTWPGPVTFNLAGATGSGKESREEEKFWYRLRNHLPKPARACRSTTTWIFRKGRCSRWSYCSTDSKQNLLDSKSLEDSMGFRSSGGSIQAAQTARVI